MGRLLWASRPAALLIPFFAGLRIEARYLTPGGYRGYSCCSNP
jgi:hypothetical protein